ncbi:MAG: glutamate-5-semialdehyde dehydrogenase [Muribaculaceae bacterium]|nr:glutamate-5-semialdehyde dehydrogenase [Muribaculaceae bacterium]
MIMKKIFEAVKAASHSLALIPDDKKNSILLKLADAIIVNADTLLEANAQDLARMDRDNPLYDRLQLTQERLEGIATDMRHVASLPSPLGIITNERTLDNGLYLRRISVPFGVIGVIYEARPNVSFDVFSLCFKSGNACVLKGGKDADCSNRAIVALIRSILDTEGLNPDVVVLLPATHEATGEMLNAVGYIDVCIPRGGRGLIDFVRNNARIPVIETGAGVVHAYFDKDGDLEKGRAIVDNAKTRRVSVCNALDCLLVHKDRVGDIDALLEPMKDRVTFHNDEYGREWMSYDLSIKVVDSLDDALAHIAQYSSGHSECIITENEEAAQRFRMEVDAACVYVNAPTSFTDGAQFGLGAEIGISTQKLGPRGPMALVEMTTYKWLIDGNGQTRP